jgi:nitrite reductase/ring-hydroxylating ferredoxin subunit/uncharacterized membrane protein
MRSKVAFRGHPIHPALIPFPLAFLVGAFAFDAVGALLRRPDFWVTGRLLVIAGIAMGLLAAVPGVVDYLGTVPPRSSGKQRATRHALANSSALLLFGLSLLFRDDTGAPGVAGLLLQAAGAGLLGFGSWLGGTLVTRNQISIDHRYAGAGKWKEESFAEANGPVTVAKTDELEVDQMKLVRIGDRRVVVARTQDGYVAFDDRCTHRGGSLADGVLICGTVQCPWHGSQFDVRSGEVRAGPAREPISCHRITEANGEVRLELDR